MSLDVYLQVDSPVCRAPSDGIFVRRDGATVEITRAEWVRLYPDREPVTMATEELDVDGTVFSLNITHNLAEMAEVAGLYEACWKPEVLQVKCASQLIGLLSRGLELLRSDPEQFKQFNPKNGWGDYYGLVDFVEAYLSACQSYPEATVVVSR